VSARSYDGQENGAPQRLEHMYLRGAAASVTAARQSSAAAAIPMQAAARRIGMRRQGLRKKENTSGENGPAKN